jgi:hypothetical protein
MKRTFNYTDRKRIPREKVQIALRKQEPNPPTFDARIDLSELKLPPDGRVYVEAYYRTSYMRFDYGTVEEPRCSGDKTLSDIDNRDLIYFRVKVTDLKGEQGRLLAEADGLIANSTECPGNRVSILEVKFDELGNLPWRLDITDSATPVLVVNKRIDNKEYVRSNPTFFALVYPAVVREILTFIFNAEHEYDPEGDDWRDRWLRFVTALPRVEEMPAGKDVDAARPWIDSSVQAFCDHQPACATFLETLAAEEKP